MIGGFIITGTQTKTVIVRGIGPSLSVPGALADPVIEVHGSSGELIATNDNWQDATTRQQIIDSGLAPTNDLESALWGVINPGAYTVVVRGKNNATGVGLFEVYDLDQTVPSKLANVSTRGFVSTGDNVMIGGIIIMGSTPANVLVRAIGPSLASFGVPNALQDPTLELHDGNGALLASNDNWRTDQEAEILGTFIAPTDDRESAILRNLAPGAYTAILRGSGNSSGIALIEAYQLDAGAHFTPGAEIEVTPPQTIGPTGGAINAPPGSALAGISVEIPAGALSRNSDVSLLSNTGTLATIAGAHSGKNIVLHSSTVTTFDQPVSITIPFSPSQGIPVPYFVDESGRLHVLQLLRIDATNNTATFQTFHASIFTWIMDKLGLGPPPAPSSYTTAFRPNPDGFQVVNRGSVYVREGECLGMSSFSLWYFEDVKAAEGDFYPRFMNVIGNDSDGNPRRGQNIIATRAFISIAQQWTTYFPAFSGEQNLTDTQNYSIIKNALLNTANPVILYLYHKTRPPTDAHSVLAYAYNNTGLQIYDVNLPGTTQSIGFNAGTSSFNPYSVFNGIIYNGDGSFPVTEPYSSILAAAKANFNSSADATINITSHSNGATVTNRVATITGTIGSGQVLVEKLKIHVGSTAFQTNVSANGAFSVEVTLQNGVNHLQFTTQGRNSFGNLIDLPNNMARIDFTLVANVTASVIRATLTWNTNDTDLDLYVIDPNGDFSAYYHRCTADGACLDHDVVTGYGPEQWLLTTANTVRYGQDYRVRVHYYSDHGHGPSNYTVAVQLYDGASAVTSYYSGNLAVSNPNNHLPTDNGPDWADIVIVRPVATLGPVSESMLRPVPPGEPLIITVPVPPFEQTIKR